MSTTEIAPENAPPPLLPGSEQRPWAARLVPLALVVGLVAVAVGMDWHREISLERLVRYRDALDLVVTRYDVASLAAFVGLFAVMTVLAIPMGMVLAVAGGFVFGAVAGGLASIAGVTIGAVLVFLMARTRFGALLGWRDRFESVRLTADFDEGAFRRLMGLRLGWQPPYFLTNVVPALAGMQLLPFVAATALGLVLPAFALAFAGAGLDSVLAALFGPYKACLAATGAGCELDFNLNTVVTQQSLIALVALSVAAVLPVAVGRLRSRPQKPVATGTGERLAPELCVIGAGAGGFAIATAAAALGVPVVLIEKSRTGDDDLDAGCMPSKALIAAGRRAETLRAAAPFGVKSPRASVEFYGVNDHVHGVIGALAPNTSRERLIGLGVRVIEGDARFKDADTVAVGDQYEIKARHFVVATGSQPLLPPIPGLDQTPFLTSETVFEARERPKHLIVVGLDASGLELAQAFRRLGSEVTVLDTAQTPLVQEDPECVQVVVDRLAREGVTIRSGVTIARVRRVRTKVEVVLAGAEEETIEGSDLVIMAGRRPALDGLDLDAGRIKHGRGGIFIDRTMRTTNKRVYAVGDVVGFPASTHAAHYHADLVIRHALFRQPVKMNADGVPRVIFTDPEFAHVGLSETQARKRHRSIRVLRWPYFENDRAQAERETAGHIKVVTDRKGTILGATIVGAAAGESITAWTLAIDQRLNVRVFAGIIVPYPTFSEVGKRAAMMHVTPRLTTSWGRRVLNLMRKPG